MSQEASAETREAAETKPELYKGALYAVRLDRSQAGVLIGNKEDSDIGKIAEDASKDSDLVVVRHGEVLLDEKIYIGLPVESKKSILDHSDNYRSRIVVDLESLDEVRGRTDELVALLDSIGITDEVMKGPVADHLKLYILY
jgi:hypothetical protein